MQKRYTIYDIKRIHKEKTGGYYFDRDTMRDWNQTLKDFTVRNIKGRVFAYCVGDGHASFVEFFPKTGKLKPVDRNYKAGDDRLLWIENFLTEVETA